MYRKQTAEEQVAKMQHLINFGKVEEKKSSAPVVEFKRKAANGKTYGIIRESTKYYIMEAPQKDTEVLAEDFSYIGGFNNRKENEFSSYTKAANALNLKLMSINESVNKSERIILETPVVKAEWEDSITESMRKEIDRFKQITNNVDYILKEDKSSVPSAHTLPEAPAKNPSEKEVNRPFTDTAVANGDKDFKKEQTNHEKAGGPYNEKAEYNGTSDKTPGNGADDGTYCEKAKFTPENSVADQHPKGGKVVRVEENKKPTIRLRLTEEQVLAWNDNKNYMDKSNGTEIGSSAPFTDELGEPSNQTEAPTEKIHESETTFIYGDNQSNPTPGTNDVGDTAPYDKKVNEDIVPPEDAAGFDELEGIDDDITGLDGVDDDDFGFEDDDLIDRTPEEMEDDIEYEVTPDEDDVELDNSRYSNKGMKGLDRWQDTWNKFDDDDLGGGYDDFNIFDSYNRSNEAIYEVKLDDFGKHPAYRKEPMSLPPNKETAINGAKEWDDESVKGEEPFGQKIGDGAPYDKVVNKMTESIMRNLLSSKKKV